MVFCTSITNWLRQTDEQINYRNEMVLCIHGNFLYNENDNIGSRNYSKCSTWNNLIHALIMDDKILFPIKTAFWIPKTEGTIQEIV